MSMDRREWRRWKGGKENDEVESGRKIKEGERESVRQKGEIRFEWKGGERERMRGTKRDDREWEWIGENERDERRRKREWGKKVNKCQTKYEDLILSK